MPVRVLDYSALTEPVSSADVAAWRRAARASGAPWASDSTPLAAIVPVVLIALVAVFFFGGGLVSLFASGIQNGNPVGILLPLLFVVGVIAVVIAVARARLNRGGTWEGWMRLDRFARANGMLFTPRDAQPSYPGEIFRVGRDAAVLSHLESGGGIAGPGRFLDLGNYRYTTGSGRSQTVHHWGFLAMRLDRAMPNIVLDSKANNTIFGSNLPTVLARDQVLPLEGDFDKHFTLYCPQEYEQDALYIFTPDLMALLIDEAAPFDVELVDQWMFVYSAKPFAMTDPAVLQRLFTIADTVGAKALDQTEHYADDRVGDGAANIVAPQGARLKRGVSTLGIVIIAALIAFWGWNLLGPFFGR